MYAYTNPFGIDIAAMIITSIKREIMIMYLLNNTSFLYFLSPFLTRFALTTRMK